MDFSTVKTTANVQEWQYLTKERFEDVVPERDIVLVTVSPLEVHGPHLPLVTDNFEAEGLALRTMELMNEQRPNLRFLHLPPIYVATDVVPQKGSLAFRSKTLRYVLEDLWQTLAAQGFKNIWISNFHGGPRHFLAIEDVCCRISERHNVKMVSIFGMMISRLTQHGSTDLNQVLGNVTGWGSAALKGDTHGGAVETSMMLHLLGQYVGPYQNLPRKTVESEVEREGGKRVTGRGLTSFFRMFAQNLHYFAKHSYTGNPALGDAAVGKKVVDALAGHAAPELLLLLDGKIQAKDCVSPLFKYRHVFLSDRVGNLFERWLGFRNPIR